MKILTESFEAPYLKAFVTNLGKYNEGDLVGKWVEFPIDEDDFEYGAVYDDRESVENIKELFESSWNLANDLDISSIVEN